MRRALWLIPVLLFLAFVTGREEVIRDMSPLALELTERFGATSLTYTTHGDQRRLELMLTDKRWHGLNARVPDSAKVIARFALDRLGEMTRPDTVVVNIRTTYKWGGRVTGSSGVHLATADL